MRIAVDARVLMDRRRSGVGEYLYRLLDHLLTIDQANEYFLFYNAVGRRVASLPNWSQATIIKTSIPNKLLNYGGWRLLNYPTIDRLLGFHPDVWWMPHFNFIALDQRAKNLLTVHDLSFLRYPEFFGWRQNFWHRQLRIRRLLSRVDKIVAISEATARDLEECCGVPADKIKVIYSGATQLVAGNVTDHRLNNLPDKFVLAVGTLEPRKNLAGLIEAFGILKSRHAELSEIGLVTIGSDGWKHRRLSDDLKNFSEPLNIQHWGYVSDQLKAELYKRATVLAFPSFYEGFGFPPLEAAAAGLPVVASHLSAMPEVLGEAAMLIDPDDAQSMADGLYIALTNKVWRQQAIIAGRLAAERLSWLNAAQQYKQILTNF